MTGIEAAAAVYLFHMGEAAGAAPVNAFWDPNTPSVEADGEETVAGPGGGAALEHLAEAPGPRRLQDRALLYS